MKFIIEKEALLETLQKVLGPTTTKQNFPALNSVFISSTQSNLKLVTTDLDTTIITIQKASVEEKGKAAIPMKKFISIIRELPSREITMEATKNNLLIRCGKIEFKISTFDAEEFPKVEESQKATLIKILPEVLGEMIRLTSFCAGQEETNYVLSGTLFEIQDDKIKLVATDGKRLSYIQRKLHHTQPEVKTKLSFIVPIRAIQELAKLIKEREEELFLSVEENRVGFDFKDTQFITRTIEGEFPNYSQYIPKESSDNLTLNRKEFLAALKRADLLSTPDYQGVKLELKKDSVVVSKSTPQLGEAKEVIGAQYSGAPMQIGFNPQYLMDALKNMSQEEAHIDFSGADKPAVIRSEGYVYLVLPIKL